MLGEGYPCQGAPHLLQGSKGALKGSLAHPSWLALEGLCPPVAWLPAALHKQARCRRLQRQQHQQHQLLVLFPTRLLEVRGLFAFGSGCVWLLFVEHTVPRPSLLFEVLSFDYVSWGSAVSGASSVCWFWCCMQLPLLRRLVLQAGLLKFLELPLEGAKASPSG